MRNINILSCTVPALGLLLLDSKDAKCGKNWQIIIDIEHVLYTPVNILLNYFQLLTSYDCLNKNVQKEKCKKKLVALSTFRAHINNKKTNL